jgi:microcystin degradation protein MlrC
VVDIGDGNHVIVTTYKHQALDDQAFRAYGIDFDALDIIVVKSRVHFRAYYDDVAGEVIVVDAPGLGPADLNQFNFENVPADTYPVGKEWQ